MANTPSNQECKNLAQLVEMISVAGRITSEDQLLIQKLSTVPMATSDILAIRHLSDLIQRGAIKKPAA